MGRTWYHAIVDKIGNLEKESPSWIPHCQPTLFFQLTKIALCVALLCVSSYIAIPLPFTSVVLTAQTLVINVVALILTPVQSACAVGLYILLGICGLPVFAGGTAGIGRIIGPTGGFIVGFLVAAPCYQRNKRRARPMAPVLPCHHRSGDPHHRLFGDGLYVLVSEDGDRGSGYRGRLAVSPWRRDQMYCGLLLRLCPQ